MEAALAVADEEEEEEEEEEGWERVAVVVADGETKAEDCGET